MNKKNVNKLWCWGLFIMCFVMGYLLYSTQWIILSIVFFITGGISLLIAYIGRNVDSQNKNLLMCPKCKIGNQLYNLNNNHNSTIFIYRERGQTVKTNNESDLFYLICFKCKDIVEWAQDSNNISGSAKFGFQYFKTKEITKKDLSIAIQEAEQSCSVHSIDRLKKINI